MRLLLVEDTMELAQAIATGLRRTGHTVDVVGDVEAADAVLRANSYNVVILDLNLPDGDGLTLLRTMRQRNDQTPTVILTARGSLEDRVKGLDVGADDYMTKPFDFQELEARLRAIQRRDAGRRGATIAVGNVVFDTVARAVYIDGKPLNLPRRELVLLETLMLRLGHVVSKEQLIACLAGFEEDLSAAAIELYISRLRKRLSQADLKIRTLRGLGYLLEAA
ncbi:MAG: response regulator transcription factor [Pseudomonadota bacterium]